MKKTVITILGSGSFGTALACVLASDHLEIRIWGNEKEQLDEINIERTNKRFLKDILIPEPVKACYDIKDALKDTEIILFVVPSQAIREVGEYIKPFINDKIYIANLAKGMEVKTKKRLSMVLEEVFPHNPLVIISGPSHAEELALKHPASVVAASKKLEYASFIQDALSNQYFRIYTNQDIIGVEYGGILKNIIALAGGISDGLGFGVNTKALLITRGLVEMSRFGQFFGANPETFQGLSGIGDLVVTATSVLSRNWTFGNKIGQGKSVNEALSEMSMVVEGINATRVAYELAKEFNIDMPITSAVYGVLYDNKKPKDAVAELMTRERKEEF